MVACSLAAATLAFSLDAHAGIGAPATDANGVLHYPVTSANEGSTPNDLRVVLPAGLLATDQRRFLYVLPVEAGVTTAYGDPVATVRALGVLDAFGLILVVPSFTQIPWYGDNPTDPTLRQETYFVDDIVAGLDALYSSTSQPGDSGVPLPPRRLLLGFSKSGFGAVSLLLRHGHLFDAAAAWDAPLNQTALSSLPGMQTVFGTQSNFDAYAIPNALPLDAVELAGPARFWLGGYSSQTSWRNDMVAVHTQMTGLGVAHVWVDGPMRAHRWDSGWIGNAVAFLNQAAPELDGGVDAGAEAGADGSADAGMGGDADAGVATTADASADARPETSDASGDAAARGCAGGCAVGTAPWSPRAGAWALALVLLGLIRRMPRGPLGSLSLVMVLLPHGRCP